MWSQDGRSVAIVNGRDMGDRADLCDALVESLELPTVVEADEEAVLSQIGEALTERPDTLLLLDDIDHVRAGVIDILDVLTEFESLRIVVTGRRSLGLSSVCEIELQPLPPQDAMTLFLHRARRSRPGYDPSTTPSETLEALVETLDYLPLALELAAGRLAILSPQDLLERMDQRFQMLRSPGTSTQRPPIALDEVIGLSWELLAPLERRVLSQCTVFRGGFGLEAAEAIIETGEPQQWVGDVLQALAEKSFLTVASGEGDESVRFSLLESIREYVSRQADADVLKRARECHGRVFYEWARQWSQAIYGHQGAAPLQRLIGESANLLAAVETLHEKEPAKAMALLCALEPTFELRGVVGTYLDRLERYGADIDRSAQDWPVAREALTRARVLNQIGRLTQALDELQRARQSGGEDASFDGPEAGEIELCQGHIFRNQGRRQEAREIWTEGLEIVTDPFLRFRFHQALGMLELDHCRFGAEEESEQALERGIELLRKAYEFSAHKTHALYRAEPTASWAMALGLRGESRRAIEMLRSQAQRQAEKGYGEGEA